MSTQDILNRVALIEQAVNSVLVRPQSVIQNEASGFVFDVIGDEEANFRSEITDHFVEDNTAVQDHIAVGPERYTIKGFVGELTDAPPFSLGLLGALVPRLGLLDAFIPTFTTQATQFYNILSNIQAITGNAIEQAETLYGLFTQKTTPVTQQQQAYNFFRQSWFTRQLMTIQTPYKTYTNMAIEIVKICQRDESNMVSDFSITFKEIRTVKTYVSPISAPVPSDGKATAVMTPAVDNGITSGTLVASENLSTQTLRIRGDQA